MLRTPRPLLCQLVLLVPMSIVAGVLGCGSGSPPPAAPASDTKPAVTAPIANPPRELSTPPISSPQYSTPSGTPREATEVRTPRPPIAPRRESDFASLLEEADEKPFEASTKPQFNEGKILTAGIRKLESKHLVLYTDLPSSPAIDELPHVFDLALPQWCEYFGIEPAKVEQWQMIGCLMDEQNRFAGAGLFPDDLPEFPHGYHRGWQFWVYKQPSDYYARHLVLHEGTHAFMRSFMGGAGPPWFMEGMAEYVGTHRWEEGKLTLRYMPRSNEEVPYWGRVKIIQDDFAANRGLTLDNVLTLGPQAHRQTEAYAWSWAAVIMLAEHPLSKRAFREMFEEVKLEAGPFAAKLKSKLAEAWPKLCEQWQLFVVQMDYGYEIEANAIAYVPPEPLPPAGAKVTLEATHGWQSSGYRLKAGKRYHVAATGRYQLASDPEPWPSEAGGVTLRYYRGRPLGMLLGAQCQEWPVADTLTPLANPMGIGLAQDITPEEDCILFLSINENPSEWSDNSGSLTVEIKAVD